MEQHHCHELCCGRQHVWTHELINEERCATSVLIPLVLSWPCRVVCSQLTSMCANSSKAAEKSKDLNVCQQQQTKRSGREIREVAVAEREPPPGVKPVLRCGCRGSNAHERCYPRLAGSRLGKTYRRVVIFAAVIFLKDATEKQRRPSGPKQTIVEQGLHPHPGPAKRRLCYKTAPGEAGEERMTRRRMR